MLIACCGLPGAAKTTPAHRVAQRRQAAYLRIDAIEEALLPDGGSRLVDRGAGYRLADAIAEENPNLGRTVIADCVNPPKITREACCAVARRTAVALIAVVVSCCDSAQHQSRVAARPQGTRGSVWENIRNRALRGNGACLCCDQYGRSQHGTVPSGLGGRGAAPP